MIVETIDLYLKSNNLPFSKIRSKHFILLFKHTNLFESLHSILESFKKPIDKLNAFTQTRIKTISNIHWHLFIHIYCFFQNGLPDYDILWLCAWTSRPNNTLHRKQIITNHTVICLLEMYVCLYTFGNDLHLPKLLLVLLVFARVLVI